jgi:hypothetical protein
MDFSLTWEQRAFADTGRLNRNAHAGGGDCLPDRG